METILSNKNNFSMIVKKILQAFLLLCFFLSFSFVSWANEESRPTRQELFKASVKKTFEEIRKELAITYKKEIQQLKGETGIESLACPKGYIPVPGNRELGTQDFCVMQFEAKAWIDDSPKNNQVDKKEIRSNGCNGEGTWCRGGKPNWGLNDYIPVSVAQGRPWRSINRDNALAKCRQLNDIFSTDKDMEYDLISNRQWQTIARNIETAASELV